MSFSPGQQQNPIAALQPFLGNLASGGAPTGNIPPQLLQLLGKLGGAGQQQPGMAPGGMQMPGMAPNLAGSALASPTGGTGSVAAQQLMQQQQSLAKPAAPSAPPPSMPPPMMPSNSSAPGSDPLAAAQQQAQGILQSGASPEMQAQAWQTFQKNLGSLFPDYVAPTAVSNKDGTRVQVMNNDASLSWIDRLPQNQAPATGQVAKGPFGLPIGQGPSIGSVAGSGYFDPQQGMYQPAAAGSLGRQYESTPEYLNSLPQPTHDAAFSQGNLDDYLATYSPEFLASNLSATNQGSFASPQQQTQPSQQAAPSNGLPQSNAPFFAPPPTPPTFFANPIAPQQQPDPMTDPDAMAALLQQVLQQQPEGAPFGAAMPQQTQQERLQNLFASRI